MFKKNLKKKNGFRSILMYHFDYLLACFVAARFFYSKATIDSVNALFFMMIFPFLTKIGVITIKMDFFINRIFVLKTRIQNSA